MAESYIEIEDELNNALSRIGRDNGEINEKVSSLTVQELLKQMEIDKFEKLYISSAILLKDELEGEQQPKKQVKNFDEILDNVETLTEYNLKRRNVYEHISQDEQDKLKNMSNFYLIPNTVNKKVSIGKIEETQKVSIHTVVDVEGFDLFTIIDEQNISISKNLKEKIEQYLQVYYSEDIRNGKINVDEVIESFTPKNIDELYMILGSEYTVSMRFLPDRIDEYAIQKGITLKTIGEKKVDLREYDNLDQNNKVQIKEKTDGNEKNDGQKTFEESDFNQNKELEDDKKRKNQSDKKDFESKEGFIQRIARYNNVSPEVVNTREIQNFDKIEEDLGIHFPMSQRSDIIAVRIPTNKVTSKGSAYRTFLASKSTGMTIDANGRCDTRKGKMYDFDEVENYFRFKLRGGPDGGPAGKPLKKDEDRDYMTFLDDKNDIKEEKYVNNGKQKDALRDDRRQYLKDTEAIDKLLKEAIDKYQKKPTQDNYKVVKDLIKEKISLDNKYNALDNQKEVSQKTIKNAEKILNKENDDDDFFPIPGGRFFH